MKRKLCNRRVQLITLGGTIGTGLFLGSAGVLELAGPSMVLGYLIAGFIAFLTMRFLGEMLVEDPISSLFSQFAKQHWGGFAGFFAGWICCRKIYTILVARSSKLVGGDNLFLF